VSQADLFCSYLPHTQTAALNMDGNKITASHLLYRDLQTFQFPIRGRVFIKDNRTSCDGQQGPCSISVGFTLELVQYEIPCPDDILRFTSSEYSVARWTEPVVRKLSGLPHPFSGSTTPGLNMKLGETLVKYETDIDPSQNPATRVTCNFTVWSMSFPNS
jgi:hypothetical protein